MLDNLIGSSDAGYRILEWIEWAALVIEILAVVIIVVSIFYALGHYLFHSIMRPEYENQY